MNHLKMIRLLLCILILVAFLPSFGTSLAGKTALQASITSPAIIEIFDMYRDQIQQAMQVFGALGSIALILSAIFPINLQQAHRIASIALHTLLGTAFAFSVTALRYQPSCPKAVLAIGATTAFINILSGILHEVTVLEWLTVALFLSYLVLLSRFTRRLEEKVS